MKKLITHQEFLTFSNASTILKDNWTPKFFLYTIPVRQVCRIQSHFTESHGSSRLWKFFFCPPLYLDWNETLVALSPLARACLVHNASKKKRETERKKKETARPVAPYLTGTSFSNGPFARFHARLPAKRTNRGKSKVEVACATAVAHVLPASLHSSAACHPHFRLTTLFLFLCVCATYMRF